MEPNTLADFPAYRIYQPYEGRKFRHGEVIAIPFESQRHGTLYHFFTLGTVAGYAIQNGEDPFPAVEDAKARGHDLYWVNANAVCLSARPIAKEHVPGFKFGDIIILQGHRFRLDPAANNNVKLVELVPVILRNDGGRWHSWIGTSDGKTALFSTGGHKTEKEAREALAPHL